MSSHPQQPYGSGPQPGGYGQQPPGQGYGQQQPGSYGSGPSAPQSPTSFPQGGYGPQGGQSAAGYPGQPHGQGYPQQSAPQPGSQQGPQHGGYGGQPGGSPYGGQPGSPPQHAGPSQQQHPGPQAAQHPAPGQPGQPSGPYGSSPAPGAKRSRTPLLIGGGALALVLVLGLLGWFLWPSLAKQPTLAQDKVEQVYNPAIGGMGNRKDVKPRPASGYFKTSSKDECVIQVGNVLAGGQVVMPIDSVADGGASEHGWFVLFSTPDDAKATMKTLNSTLTSCRGGGLKAGSSSTRSAPAWYTYDGPFDATDKTPSAQVVAVQYGNTITVSTPQAAKSPATYAKQLKDRIDSLTA